MSALVPKECPVCFGTCVVHCASPTCTWWKCVGTSGRACGSYGDVRAGKQHLAVPR